MYTNLAIGTVVTNNLTPAIHTGTPVTIDNSSAFPFPFKIDHVFRFGTQMQVTDKIGTRVVPVSVYRHAVRVHGVRLGR